MHAVSIHLEKCCRKKRDKLMEGQGQPRGPWGAWGESGGWNVSLPCPAAPLRFPLEHCRGERQLRSHTDVGHTYLRIKDGFFLLSFS